MACIKTYDNKNKLRLLGWSSVKRDHSSPLSRNEQKMWQMADGRYEGRGEEEPMTYGDKKNFEKRNLEGNLDRRKGRKIHRPVGGIGSSF